MARLPTVGGDSNAWGTVLNDYLTNKGPGFGTSLPGSPQDEAEYILVDSTTNPAYQWRLRYNAGSSSSYKWEYVGGTPWRRNYTGPATIATGSFIVIGANGTAPRAGEYDVDFAVRVGFVVAGNITVTVGFNGDTGGISTEANLQAGDTVTLCRFISGTIPSAGQAIALYGFQDTGAGQQSYAWQEMNIRPRRLA